MKEREAAAERFQRALGLTPLLARLLAQRGWRDTAELTAFLYPRLEHAHSPWLMLGMERAVGRILEAVEAGERIRILGDYDADGTIATVILRQALRTVGVEASYHLPQRLNEGYGLHRDAIEQAVRDGVRLAITVDTGIRENAALEEARALGLEVIVTDHHLPGATLPPAVAILNPHQAGCGYPDKHLCGSGVAFKLAQGLLERSGRVEGPTPPLWPPALRSYLKLVALGTIADAVPLIGENRVLARFGLEGLAAPVNPGLQALLATALPARGPAGGRVSSGDVSFRLAPRLNAAGRLGRADQVVELFFAPRAQAQAQAAALEALNLQRQQICASIEAAMAQRWAERPEELEAAVLVLAGAGWHRGVLGIVASRVLERTGKPVLVASLEPRAEGGLQAHGSGRAPRGVHLLEMLESCGELFERFGGHAQAVGFSLPAERLETLRERLQGAAAGIAGRDADDAESGEVCEVKLGELDVNFARQLQRLEPWGAANREPVFRARGVRLAAAPMRLKDRHAKFVLEQTGARQTALYWNLWRDGAYQEPAGSGHRRPRWEALNPGMELDVSFQLEHSTHPQYGERVQLILRDFLSAGDRGRAHAGPLHRTAESSR